MDAEVIVVGAGPTGLMLAGELALAGVDVLVLEQLAQPHGQSRGLGFTARTAESFEQRGLMRRFGETSTSPIGHFGGLQLDFTVLEGAHFGVRGVLQATTEAVLEGWAIERGARVRRGCAFVGMVDDGQGVDVQVHGPDGPELLRTGYLVGCDGGRSSVRGAAGFDFPGQAPQLEMYLADVRGAKLRPRFLGEMVNGGMVMAAPLGDDVDRIIVCERGTRPRQDGVDVGWVEVSAAWKRLTGEDIQEREALWVSAFTDAARQAGQYRRGRVLIAGDAAHIHLPAGGQGLSVGVQDAVNLGWKLAAEVRGWAPAGLLDSYQSERHPVGARLLTNTQAQGLLFLTGPQMQPLRDVMTELIQIEDVARHLAGMVSGFDVHYPVGPGRHPLLGRRMPPQTLVNGGKTSTAEVLHAGRGVLLDLSDDAGIRDTAAAWADRVDVVTATALAAGDTSQIQDTDAVLIRPDGYVAWTAPGTDADLAQAFTRWFGPPKSSAQTS
jgi:bifunctional hydroxylase/dehydrase